MKKTTPWLTIIALTVALLVSGLQTKAYIFNSYRYPGDTAVAKTTDTTKAKQGLFKKLISVLHFKANAQQREKKRVLSIINSLSIGDSIRISADSLRGMIISLSDKQDKYYDSLLILIDSIAKKPTVINYITPAPKPPPTPSPSEEIVVDSTETADSDLKDALNALLPVITGKTEADKKEEKEKRQSLSILHKLVNKDSVVVRRQEGRSVKEFAFTMKKEAQFYAFYNTLTPFDYSVFPFHVFDWWVYDALLLNGTTGSFKDLTVWDSSATLINTARKAGCRIAFTVLQDIDKSTSLFLKSTAAQQKLSDYILSLLSQQKISGINIYFRKLTAADKDHFTTFVSFISRALKSTDSTFSIGITLPATTSLDIYNITALNSYCDRFFISDSTALSYYLNQKIPASKFIFTVPVSSDRMNPVEIISGQFEMVKDSKLGGAGICYSGNHLNYSMAWDAMLFKLTQLDSVIIKDSALAPLTFWQLLYRRFALYNYILNNPCEECFQDLQSDSAASNRMVQYVQDLGIDSIVRAHNQQAAKTTKDPVLLKKLLITEVEYIISELTHVMLFVALLFFVITAVTAIIYIYNLKNIGDEWKKKKLVARLLILFTTLFTLSLFSYVFANDNIPFFNESAEIKIHNQSVERDPAGNYYKHNYYCYPDNGCANMSLYTLLGIILLGTGVGILITRFLILPLLQRNDTP